RTIPFFGLIGRTTKTSAMHPVIGTAGRAAALIPRPATGETTIQIFGRDLVDKSAGLILHKVTKPISRVGVGDPKSLFSARDHDVKQPPLFLQLFPGIDRHGVRK